ncbi:MAG: hypothetical protein ACLP6G_19560 [Terriglobales bacterium]
MQARIILLLELLLLSSVAVAHVGSPEVYCEGDAGPYHLLVTVRPPSVIPGLAQVEILVTTGSASNIKIIPILTNGKEESLPPMADEMQQVPGDKNSFLTEVWLMSSGSWELRAEVEGAQGKGTLAVPVTAFARASVPMQRALGIFLLGFMLFLSVGAISLAGASARESILTPGAVPSSADVGRGRIAMVMAALAVTAVLFLGSWMWKRAAYQAENKVYAPPELTASLEAGDRLTLHMGRNLLFEQRMEQWSMGLIPDHGHLMHLILLRVPAMDRFYHLHPEQAADGSFSLVLPPLSAGHYRMFADIVRRSGFAETMTTSIDLPDIPGQPLVGDDSATDAPAFVPPAGNAVLTAPLPDGGRMVWERDSSPLPIAKLTWFRFRVEDSQGKPVEDLEPYMGMLGHAEFVSSDQSVFAHIHPVGSVSMAAMELMQRNVGNPMGHSAQGDMHMQALPATVSFPYGFPKAGNYRLFVQIKRHGQVETGVFDAGVR